MCDYRANVSGLDAPLETFESEGLSRRYGEVIEVVEEARPLVRVVAAAFDAKLSHAPVRHVTAV
jgi:coproporphyrinogen III oxidase-like Fe-S oxidoreductase